jgi:uncharacterized protein YozE (UPF0346 family)
MTRSFYSWLGKFLEKDSAIGDLADDVYNDLTFPKRATTYNTVRDYLSLIVTSGMNMAHVLLLWIQYF